MALGSRPRLTVDGPCPMEYRGARACGDLGRDPWSALERTESFHQDDVEFAHVRAQSLCQNSHDLHAHVCVDPSSLRAEQYESSTQPCPQSCNIAST